MKTIRLSAIAIMVAAISQAAPITVITNYFPGYVFVTNGWTASAEGVFIPLASLTNSTPPNLLTAANAVADGAASDVRALLYAINDTAYAAYDGTTENNRPANATLSRVSTSSSTTSYQTTHALKTKFTASAAVLTPE